MCLDVSVCACGSVYVYWLTMATAAGQLEECFFASYCQSPSNCLKGERTLLAMTRTSDNSLHNFKYFLAIVVVIFVAVFIVVA